MSVYGSADDTARDALLEADRDRALPLLAAGRSYAAVGRDIGRSERTISRWMSDSAYAKRVADTRREQIAVVSGQLNDLLTQAVTALKEVLTDGTPNERLRAAQIAFNSESRYRAVLDTEVRLDDVERSLQEALAAAERAAERR